MCVCVCVEVFDRDDFREVCVSVPQKFYTVIFVLSDPLGSSLMLFGLRG